MSEVQAMRVGFGYDMHRLVEGRKLILGGVEIPHNKGLLGHSDADVLIHAVCDALLGSTAHGDIGVIFPDSDTKYRGISSLKLLQKVGTILAGKGAEVGNIDSTVIAEEPKLRNFIPEMRKNIADALAIDINRISVKSTTNEGLGATGRKEGIAAHCVVLVSSKTGVLDGK